MKHIAAKMLIITWSYFILITVLFIIMIKTYVGTFWFTVIVLLLLTIFVSSIILLGKKQKEARNMVENTIISKKEKSEHNIAGLILLMLILQSWYLFSSLIKLNWSRHRIAIIMYVDTVLFLAIFNVVYFLHFRKYDKQLNKTASLHSIQ